MPMLQATLADELKKMEPTDQESVAIQKLVDAYGKFAEGAQAVSPILPAGVAAGKAAMQAALTGMSASGAAAGKIAAAIVAFWGAVAAGLASSFAGATAITPPPNATLAAGLPAAFAANVAGQLSLADSASAIATVMHTNAIVGGLVVTPPSVSTPIT